MVITTKDYHKQGTIDSSHPTSRESLLLWRKSTLGVCSITADDLVPSHSSNRRLDGRTGPMEDALASLTGFIQSTSKQHPLPYSLRGLTMDFEETLFRASLHPHSSTGLIQMIADVKYNGGRCKLPFYAQTRHDMWVGAIVMDAVVPVCKRYQVCLLHHPDGDPLQVSMLQGGDRLLDANGNKRHSVMAGRPMLVDCPSSTLANPENGCSIIRLCHYQSGRLLQGIQLSSTDGQTIASPIRLVFSFTEVDQTFCTDSCEASVRKPVIKSVYRCTTPIDDGTGKCTRVTRGGGKEEGVTLPPH